MTAASLPNPRSTVMELLSRWGPETLASAPVVSESQALDYCQGLATSHYENFSVLSRLVPAALRTDFAAVYAFCRWSDDLGDETGNDEAARQRSTALLAWWRSLLRECFAFAQDPGSPAPRHPVFVALAATARRHATSGLSAEPFDDLISAFEQDQRTTRYRTWDQVLDYCTRSADPVGRIVLMLGGIRPPGLDAANAEIYRLSDRTCSALQLINFWQDVRRDLLERDRVYIPLDDAGVTAEQLRDWMHRGSREGGEDPEARVGFIRTLRPLVEKTRGMFEEARVLPAMIRAANSCSGTPTGAIARLVWLFWSGGMGVLERVESAGCTTLWNRPRLSGLSKAGLLLRASLMRG
ncbi:MAG TPA: squalene/phytoene synthase family protein [Phycisphaerales bacterium]|nr:squalene/phytoene synthase family protein [Phycisphaerales bacterium]